MRGAPTTAIRQVPLQELEVLVPVGHMTLVPLVASYANCAMPRLTSLLPHLPRPHLLSKSPTWTCCSNLPRNLSSAFALQSSTFFNQSTGRRLLSPVTRRHPVGPPAAAPRRTQWPYNLRRPYVNSGVPPPCGALRCKRKVSGTLS